MNTKEKFKLFVKSHPSLLKYVKSEEMTWQKFYELYDMYGEDESVWKDYITTTTKEVKETKKSNVSSLGELMGFVKNIDLDSVENGINSLQRVLGVLQDFETNKGATENTYKPRPLYKHFED